MSSRSTFGTVKRVAAILIAIAIVLVAGIVVGQAPVLFGVDEDPEASIAFEDQQSDGANVTIDEVAVSDGGFVVVTDGDEEPLAVSDYLEEGTHENVTVERDEEATDRELLGQLTATVHQDTTGNETFAYHETGGAEDRPYLEDGFPVSDTATVTTAEDDDAVSDSFVVESVDAPASTTTNETVEIGAVISNPTDYDQQQNVDFRLDGQVLERQVLELGAGESRDVTFEVNMSGASLGTQTFGIYTNDDGALEEIEIEYPETPNVAVIDADNDSVRVNAVLPEDGFVAIENNESIIGTSDELEGGEHSNVTVEFDENATVDEDEELVAVLYEGDPGDVDAASPVEHDDEPVETTFTIADAGGDDEDAIEDDETDDTADDGGTDDGDEADET